MSSNSGNRNSIVLWGTQDLQSFKCRIGDYILGEENIFPRDSSTCEQRESERYSVINTPDILNEVNNPDQQIIDVMALSGDGPNLFILVLGGKKDLIEEAWSQINQLRRVFGDNIQEYLIVMIPGISCVECIDIRARDLNLPQQINHADLPVELGTFCRRKPFVYDNSAYSKEIVLRRKRTLETRREQNEYRPPLPPSSVPGSGYPQHRGSTAPPYNRQAPTSISSTAHDAATGHIASQSDQQRGYEEVQEVGAQPQRTEPVHQDPGEMTSNVNDPQHPGQKNIDLYIILLGQTGTGKSCTGNTLLGLGGFLSKTSSIPVTQECKDIITELYGAVVMIIDTPDFFDEGIKRREEQIAKCKQFCHLEPCVFLLVCQTGRFTESERDVLDRHEKVLETSLRDRTIVVLTHGEELKRQTMQDFIKADTHLSQIVQQCNNRCCLINNNSPDKDQVKKLLRLIPNHQRIFPKLKKKIIRDLIKVKSESENCVPS